MPRGWERFARGHLPGSLSYTPERLPPQLCSGLPGGAAPLPGDRRKTKAIALLSPSSSRGHHDKGAFKDCLEWSYVSVPLKVGAPAGGALLTPPISPGFPLVGPFPQGRRRVVRASSFQLLLLFPSLLFEYIHISQVQAFAEKEHHRKLQRKDPCPPCLPVRVPPPKSLGFYVVEMTVLI